MAEYTLAENDESRDALVGRLLGLRIQGNKPAQDWKTEITAVLDRLKMPDTIRNALEKITENSDDSNAPFDSTAVAPLISASAKPNPDFAAQVTMVIDTAILLAASRPANTPADFNAVFGPYLVEKWRAEARAQMKQLIAEGLQGSLDDAIADSRWIKTARWVMPYITSLIVFLIVLVAGGMLFTGFEVDGVATQAAKSENQIKSLVLQTQTDVASQIDAFVAGKVQQLDSAFNADTQQLDGVLKADQGTLDTATSTGTQQLNQTLKAGIDNLNATVNSTQQTFNTAAQKAQDTVSQQTNAVETDLNEEQLKFKTQTAALYDDKYGPLFENDWNGAEKNGLEKISDGSDTVISHFNEKSAQADNDYAAYTRKLDTMVGGFPAEVDALKEQVDETAKTVSSWQNVQGVQRRIDDLWRKLGDPAAKANLPILMGVLKFQDAMSIATLICSILAIGFSILANVRRRQSG